MIKHPKDEAFLFKRIDEFPIKCTRHKSIYRYNTEKNSVTAQKVTYKPKPKYAFKPRKNVLSLLSLVDNVTALRGACFFGVGRHKRV